MRMLQTHAPAIFLVIVFILMRFQIVAFSMKTLSVSVWTEGLNASKCMCHSNENALSVDEA